MAPKRMEDGESGEGERLVFRSSINWYPAAQGSDVGRVGPWLGRQRLQTFDVVGVMDCMQGLLEHLCVRLGWPCDARLAC